ncbi:MAG: hypothetical protein IJL25_10430 [Clostridia bacterium]|nr:hypothetical protein [Clostridia bacterium]
MLSDLQTENVKTVIRPTPELINRTKEAVSAASAAPIKHNAARVLLPAAAAFALVCAAVYFGTGNAPQAEPSAVTSETGSSETAQTPSFPTDSTTTQITTAAEGSSGQTEPASQGSPGGSTASNVISITLWDRYYFKSLREMAQADLTVLAVSGTVTEVYGSFGADGHVYSKFAFTVEECLKGDAAPGDVITVIEYGGMLDGMIRCYNVYRTSEPGDRLVLFLERVTDDFRENVLNGEEAYCPAAATQGTFLLTTDLTGRSAYYCCGHMFGIEDDPKEDAGFQLADFKAALGEE